MARMASRCCAASSYAADLLVQGKLLGSVSRRPPGIIAESASPREHMYMRDIHRAR